MLPIIFVHFLDRCLFLFLDLSNCIVKFLWMIPLDSVWILFSVFVLHCGRGNDQNILVLQEISQDVQRFFCDNWCSIVHHFHCSENLLVAFKKVNLIFFSLLVRIQRWQVWCIWCFLIRFQRRVQSFSWEHFRASYFRMDGDLRKCPHFCLLFCFSLLFLEQVLWESLYWIQEGFSHLLRTRGVARIAVVTFGVNIHGVRIGWLQDHR